VPQNTPTYQLDMFFADRYEADYGQYFSSTPDTSFSDIVIFKSKGIAQFKRSVD